MIRDSSSRLVSIVGGGLAGSEAAYQLAEAGFRVQLYEMRPKKLSPAHRSGNLAELVCSNSFGSFASHSPAGALKWEAEALGSKILETAWKAYVPAGMALGIDRELFAKNVTDVIKAHPNIEIIDKEVTHVDEVPRPTIIATGPLTSEPLAQSMLEHFGDKFLYFFDAIAPIIDADSVDRDIVWEADRHDRGTGDYLNCPMDKDQYEALIDSIESSEKVEAKDFEKDTPFFEGCMPIEEMVRRGRETLRHGPLSGKGLDNPKTGRWPYAVVQLRKENKAATAYNLVGFQTKMKYPEQKRIFRMIPGLENAEFLKLGSIHRNLFIHSPKRLNEDLSSKKDPFLFFAGQITGVEGYFESTAIGLLVARFLKAKVEDKTFTPPPRHSALGSLLHGITKEDKDNFQPTNINFGLLPPLEKRMKKRDKRDRQLALAREAFLEWQKNAEPGPKTEAFVESKAAQL